MVWRRLLAHAPLSVLAAVAGVAAVAAYTRLLAPADYGVYALALSVAMVAHTLMFSAVEAAAYRFRSEADATAALSDHAKTLAGLAGATLIAAALAAAGLAHVGAGGASLVFWAAAAAATRFLTRIAREDDRAVQAVARYSLLEGLQTVLGFGLGILLLLTTDLGPAAPFAGLALAGAAIALVDLPRWIARAAGGAIRPAHAASYLLYGAPLAAALAVDLAAQAGLRMIVAEARGAAAVGALFAAYGVAWRIIDIIFTWAGSATAPLLMAAYDGAGGAAAVRSIAARQAGALLALGAPAAVGVALTAEPLAALMIGPDLRADALPLIPWIALAAFLTGAGVHYFAEPFQLARRTGLRAILMAGAAGLGLALAILWIPGSGLLGAAWAATAAAGAGVAALALAGRRFLALPLPLKEAAKTALATAGMAAAVHVTPMPEGAPALFLTVGLGAIVYGGLALLLDLAEARRLASAVWKRVSVTVRTEAAE